jgi:hypothetical protein
MNEIPTPLQAAPGQESEELTLFEQALARATGRTIQDMRDTPIDVFKEKLETTGQRMMIQVNGRLVPIQSESDINATVDEALAKMEEDLKKPLPQKPKKRFGLF